MSKIRGILIGGLAMNAQELPEIDGFLRLQNPEVGENSHEFLKPYNLADSAQAHIEYLQSQNIECSSPFDVIGMSMGGMIALTMAAQSRSCFPKKTNFTILVSSPNEDHTPAVPDSMLADWMTVNPGSTNDFYRILSPFFSTKFSLENPEIVKNYAAYRAFGKNGQGSKAFMRQLSALRQFRAQQMAYQINSNECLFVGGGDDKILGPSHNRLFKEIFPSSKHFEISDLGHMINLESPKHFNPDYLEKLRG